MCVGVEARIDRSLEQREDFVSQVEAADHPLVVRPPVMGVRAVELPTWECSHQPLEQRLVASVHSQCYLRLAAVTTKMAFADEKPS
jgi:hypothetical protein